MLQLSTVRVGVARSAPGVKGAPLLSRPLTVILYAHAHKLHLRSAAVPSLVYIGVRHRVSIKYRYNVKIYFSYFRYNKIFFKFLPQYYQKHGVENICLL